MSKSLPFWDIFKKSFVLLFSNLDIFVRIVWPIIALYFALNWLVAWGLVHHLIADWCIVLFSVIASLYWHRFLILDDRAIPAVPLRLDKVVWKYFAFVAAFSLATKSLIMIAAMGLEQLPIKECAAILKGKINIENVPLAGLVIVIGVVRFRLAMILPAMAVGHAGMSLKKSWCLTQGQTRPIILLVLLYWGCMKGFAYGWEMLRRFAYPINGLLGDIIGYMGFFLAHSLMVLLPVGALALSYAFLTRQEAEMQITQE